MQNITKPFFDFTFANLEAFCRAMRPSEENPAARAAELWRTLLQNQTRFVQQSADIVRVLGEQGRGVLAGQLEKLNRDTEAVAREMAYTTTRAVAIATQARREAPDRRVFHLPLPASRERRGVVHQDRRNGLDGGRSQA